MVLIILIFVRSRPERDAADLAGYDATQFNAAIKAAGYPDKADHDKINVPVVLALLTLLMLYEAHGVRADCSAAGRVIPRAHSLHVHVAAISHRQWLVWRVLILVSFALVAMSGDIYYGLWYPVLIAGGSLLIGLAFLPETKDRDVHD